MMALARVPVCPQLQSRPRANVRCTRVCGALRPLQATSQVKHEEDQQHQQSPALAPASLFALASSLVYAGAARADELVVETDAPSLPQTLEEWIVWIMFLGVVGLLVTVTGGVAFISLTNFFDDRQEKADREGIKRVLPAKGSVTATASKAGGKDEEGEVVVPLRKALRPKKDKTKGFSDFTSRS